MAFSIKTRSDDDKRHYEWLINSKKRTIKFLKYDTYFGSFSDLLIAIRFTKSIQVDLLTKLNHPNEISQTVTKVVTINNAAKKQKNATLSYGFTSLGEFAINIDTKTNVRLKVLIIPAARIAEFRQYLVNSI